MLYPLHLFALPLLLLFALTACSQQPTTDADKEATPKTRTAKRVKLGIEKLVEDADKLLSSKRFAVVAHNASRLADGTHSVDALMQAGHRPQFIFAPEHGFRGTKAAGAKVEDGRDKQTGLEILSLYGNTKRPSKAALERVEVIVFDLQDVGARFYTYLSTLLYVMDACAEHGKQLIVLDRPNPNGWYCDGPLLETRHKSFVGVLEIPIVHGMTFGELATYINNRGLLRNKKPCDLKVIEMDGYTHSMRWDETGLPWVPPSPNLRTVAAAEWYPALCWFEGTVVSCGRGTERPFEQIGLPMHRALQKRIVLDSVKGRNTTLYVIRDHDWQPTTFRPNLSYVKFTDQTCYGLRALERPKSGEGVFTVGLHLLLNFYQEYQTYLEARPNSPPFFLKSGFFEKLAGVSNLRRQVVAGRNEQRIYESWQPGLAQFRKERKAFLRYPL